MKSKTLDPSYYSTKVPFSLVSTPQKASFTLSRNPVLHHTMNPLVRYLGEHYYPKAVAFRFAKFPDGIDLPYSVDELFQMIREAKEADLIAPITTGRYGRWGWDRKIAEDVLFVALTKKGQKWVKQNIIDQKYRIVI